MNLVHSSNPEISLRRTKSADVLEGPTPRPKSRIRALASAAIHALPDEAHSLSETFSQAKTDMQNVKQLAAEESSEAQTDVAVSRWDVAKYMMWRYGAALPYQGFDDIPGLTAFNQIQSQYGTGPAFVAVKGASFALAFGLGMAEREAQKWKATAQGLETTTYKGPLKDDILDASVNSAPWGVMRHASAARDDGAPVEIVSPARVAAMSEAYSDVNTGFYAGSTLIPGLNSWTGFGVTLAAMYQLKGTIRGYQERMSTTNGDEQESTVV